MGPYSKILNSFFSFSFTYSGNVNNLFFILKTQRQEVLTFHIKAPRRFVGPYQVIHALQILCPLQFVPGKTLVRHHSPHRKWRVKVRDIDITVRKNQRPQTSCEINRNIIYTHEKELYYGSNISDIMHLEILIVHTVYRIVLKGTKYEECVPYYIFSQRQ